MLSVENETNMFLEDSDLRERKSVIINKEELEVDLIDIYVRLKIIYKKQQYLS